MKRWWTLKPGQERDRLKAQSELGELRVVAEHPGHVVEFTNGDRSWLQGPVGKLHPFMTEADKRMAMLAALAGMWPRVKQIKARLIDGRLALFHRSTLQTFYLDGETPQAYRIALGHALHPHPSRKQERESNEYPTS